MFICRCCTENPADSLEHLFPSAIGGRRKIRDVLCAHCNNGHGATIDAHLANALKGPRMLLNITGDRGQTATVRAESTSMGKVDLTPGAVPQPVPGRPVIIDEKDGRQTIRFGSEKEVRAYLKAQERKGNKVRVIDARIHSVFPSMAEFNVELGGEEYFRAATKTALTLMAWKGLAGGIGEAELWKYVAGGSLSERVSTNVTYAKKPWPLPTTFERLAHQVTVQREAGGTLRVDVRYFGDLAVAIEASVDDPGPAWRIGYAMDPFTGKEVQTNYVSTALEGVPPRTEAAHARTRRAHDEAAKAILKRWHVEARRAVRRNLWSGISKGSFADRLFAMKRFVFTLLRRDHSRAAPDLITRLGGDAGRKSEKPEH
ncbi:HNH endonuclease [Chondromyces apiculatus]|uniref:HNH endonuclease n=1 Tax=Chondromyces apiculatus TaxID=51 RepID=UPI0009DE26C4|nr:HNH endonuclease [Chondromyces apiculatus]